MVVCDPFARNRRSRGLGRQADGAFPAAWTTWLPCGCDSHPSGVEVTAYPPCWWPDDHRCEAGINGGNPKHGRGLRPAELDMDRNTNLRRTVVTLCRLSRVDKPVPKMGSDGEPGMYHRCPGAPSQPSRRTAGSFVQRQTETRNGVSHATLSRFREQGVTRRRRVERIASEAKAPGKAGGYADGGTADEG
jgi:hypothetical protein